MKIILIGASGTIGSAVKKELSGRHEIVSLGHSRGDFTCNMASEDSIENMFKKVGSFDAVIVTAGNVHFEELSQMTAAKYAIGLNHKLMGQVNIVLIGQKYMREKGSFTLTIGILSHDPVLAGSSASMVNGAIDSFVKACAIELPRGIRINAVSPTILTESLKEYGPYFYGFESVPAERVALAYMKSVEGLQTGQIYSVE